MKVEVTKILSGDFPPWVKVICHSVSATTYWSLMGGFAQRNEFCRSAAHRIKLLLACRQSEREGVSRHNLNSLRPGDQEFISKLRDQRTGFAEAAVAFKLLEERFHRAAHRDSPSWLRQGTCVLWGNKKMR